MGFVAFFSQRAIVTVGVGEELRYGWEAFCGHFSIERALRAFGLIGS